MQIIRFDDYSLAWFYYRVNKGKRPLRDIVREITAQRKKQEAYWSQHPVICKLIGREDLLEGNQAQGQCS